MATETRPPTIPDSSPNQEEDNTLTRFGRGLIGSLRNLIQPTSEPPEEEDPDATILLGPPSVASCKAGDEEDGYAIGRGVILPASCLPSGITLIRAIGRGSFGSVWLGRNEWLREYRAIKVIPRAWFPSDEDFEREKGAYQALCGIPTRTPHLLTLHYGTEGRGELADDFYFTEMPLADDAERPGEHFLEERSDTYQPLTLQTLIDDELEDSDFLVACEVIAKLAASIHHLHTNALVHRDVKPSNIVFVDGEPHLTDYSIVGEAGVDEGPVGTRDYLDHNVANTPQQDIAALGPTFHNLVTKANSSDYPLLPDKFLARLDQAPKHENRIWGQVESIVERATFGQVPKPADDNTETPSEPIAPVRYATAMEMHDDLREVIAKAEAKARSRELLPLSLAASWVFFAAVSVPALFALTRPDTGSFSWVEAPAGSTVEIDGYTLPAGHPSLEQLEPGIREVVLHVPDHHPVETEIEIRRGRSTTPAEDLAFEANRGYLTLTDLPDGAELRIDGFAQRSFKIGDALSLEPGMRTIEVFKPHHRAWKAELEIVSGQTSNLGGVELDYHKPPEVGQPWANSGGLVFEPHGGIHVCAVPLDAKTATAYLLRSPEASSLGELASVRAGDLPNFASDTNAAGANPDLYLALPSPGQASAIIAAMERDDRAAGVLEAEQCYIQLSGDEPNGLLRPTVAPRIPGALVIETGVPGAAVEIDGRAAGTTDSRGQISVAIDMGRDYAIAIRQVGYHTTERRALIESASPDTISVRPRPNWNGAQKNSLGIMFSAIAGQNGDLLIASSETLTRHFERFCKATDRPHLAAREMDGRLQPGSPASYLSKADAKAFCRWLTKDERDRGVIGRHYEYRLPTDLEWSAAAGIAEPDRDKELAERIGLSGDRHYYPDAHAPVANVTALDSGVAEWIADPYLSPRDQQPYDITRGRADGDKFHLSTRNAFAVGMTDAQVGFRLVLAPAPLSESELAAAP